MNNLSVVGLNANDVIIITAPLRLSKKLHSLPSSLGWIIQSRGCSLGGGGGPMARPPRDRPTQPAPERAYERADPRIDRLEDTISHFYNVINELRERVSTLEKKLKLLAKDQLH